MIFENRLDGSPIRPEFRAKEMAPEILLQATTFDGKSGQ
jgi:hypothetical protein